MLEHDFPGETLFGNIITTLLGLVEIGTMVPFRTNAAATLRSDWEHPMNGAATCHAYPCIKPIHTAKLNNTHIWIFIYLDGFVGVPLHLPMHGICVKPQD